MSDNQSQAPTTPHARSAVNGMIIPLLPHQGGILHRFAQPENRLVISGTSEPKAEDDRLVSDGTPDPMLQQALQENQALRDQVISQSAVLQTLQDQMAALLANQAAVTQPPAVPAAGHILPPDGSAGLTPPAPVDQTPAALPVATQEKGGKRKSETSAAAAPVAAPSAPPVI